MPLVYVVPEESLARTADCTSSSLLLPLVVLLRRRDVLSRD